MIKTLRVLIFQEEGLWIAQGLEYDIAAQSKSLTDLPNIFAQTIMAHIMARREHNQEPFEGINKAPDNFLGG